MLKGYNIRKLETSEFEILIAKYSRAVIGNSNIIDTTALVSSQKPRRPFESIPIHFGAFQNSKFVGWTTGYSVDSSMFYIDNSAVHLRHRRKGVYSALLKAIIYQATKYGFQTIKSHHHCSLSHLIAKKLRFGFFVTGFELNPQHGPIVQLDYYVNKRRDEILRFRSGDKRPGQDVRQILKLARDNS